jgi:rRNA maturation RNase YbeY
VIHIKIFNDCLPSFSYYNKQIEKFSKQILILEKCNKANISIILSNREYVSKLKKEYFKVNVFTDVLAFNLGDNNDCLDGEVYISIEDVLENSKIYSTSFNKEFKRVLIHGILHLLGYKDNKADEKKNMNNLEKKYLTLFDKKIILIK